MSSELIIHPKGLKGPDKNKNLFAAYRPMASVHQLEVSLSYEYLFPPVMDQGQAGTCVTFATSSMVDSFVFKRDHVHIDVAQRALYSMTKQLIENGDTSPGLYAGDALTVLQKFGYVRQQDFPYGNPVDENDPHLLEVVPPNLYQKDHLLDSFVRVNPDVDEMKLAMFEHGPLAIGVEWQNAWENPDASNVLQATASGSAGGHEIVLVGYSNHKAAFRLRNSWSAAWGDQGYVWLPYQAVNFIDDIYTIAYTK